MIDCSWGDGLYTPLWVSPDPLLGLTTMPELRKLLRLTKSAFAVTLPVRYRKRLRLKDGDYVEVSLHTKDTIAIRRHKAPEKR